jgi:hypothetical protein
VRRHVTSDEIELVYDDHDSKLCFNAPGLGRSVDITVHPTDLNGFLDQLASGEWLAEHWGMVHKTLLFRSIWLDAASYEDYRVGTPDPNGVYVRLDTRVYPEDFLHEMTTDRAVSINIAARPFGAEHRTHIAEIRTQLSEHQHRLAYKLTDYLCEQIRTGQLELSATALLPFEDKTPDQIEEILET